MKSFFYYRVEFLSLIRLLGVRFWLVKLVIKVILSCFIWNFSCYLFQYEIFIFYKNFINMVSVVLNYESNSRFIFYFLEIGVWEWGVGIERIF